MPRYVSALVSEGCSAVAFRKACTAPGKSLLWNRSTPSSKAVFLLSAAIQPATKRRRVVIANRAVTRMVNNSTTLSGAITTFCFPAQLVGQELTICGCLPDDNTRKQYFSHLV